MAFFTDFNVRGHVGLLDWYTVSIAILAVVMLAAHGATYLAFKTEGPVHDRSEKWAKYLWIAVVPLLAGVLIESRIVRPDLPGRAWSNPFWWIGLIVIAASGFTLLTGLTSGRELRAFVGSNFLIVGLLATGAAAIFPVMLHSTLAPENSLSAYAVASSPTTLLRASFWWPIAFALAVFYFVFVSRRYGGKVSVQRDIQGFY
jgi:cytochrome d ubiquinol oxidase subunit II